MSRVALALASLIAVGSYAIPAQADDGSQGSYVQEVRRGGRNWGRNDGWRGGRSWGYRSNYRPYYRSHNYYRPGYYRPYYYGGYGYPGYYNRGFGFQTGNFGIWIR